MIIRSSCLIDWSTKYRCEVLRDDIKVYYRELSLIQTYRAGRVDILKGVVCSEHVHVHQNEVCVML